MNTGVIICASYFLGLIGAVTVVRLKVRSLLDMPNQRSSHDLPVPRGGGIGIWLAGVFLSWILLDSAAMILVLAVMGGVSLANDFQHIPSKVRLFLHIIFSALFVFSVIVPGFKINDMGLILLGCFFILFIAWTVNVYNFMDGIDGMAAISGIVGFGLMAQYFFYVLNEPYSAMFCLGIIAACGGFLLLNFPKAKVFMGDVGSISLGFIFAAIVVAFSRSFLDLLCFCSFLSTFYMDELYTMFLRLRNRENILKPHRQHLYQVLANEKNIAHWKVTSMFGMIQLLIGGCVMFLRQYGMAPVVAFLVLCFGAWIVVNFIVRKPATFSSNTSNKGRV